MPSKFFKGLKKAQLPKANPTPRLMEEIQKEHSQASYEAGVAQYQVYVHSKDLEQKNQRLLSLNQEAAARQKIDQENFAKTAPANAQNEVTTNE
jgi:hypothetical protein